MIERFAKEFGQHPDNIFKSTTFDTITLFLCKWQDAGEYQDSYMEVERMMNAIQTPAK